MIHINIYNILLYNALIVYFKYFETIQMKFFSISIDKKALKIVKTRLNNCSFAEVKTRKLTFTKN